MSAAVTTIWWLALGALVPLGPAERATAQTMLAALDADPFAANPLAALERVYDGGPGRKALIAELTERASAERRAGARWLVLARVELDGGRRAEAVRALERAATEAHDPAMLRRLAPMLDQLGARPPAIRAYREGAAGATAVERRYLQLRLGVLLLADGKLRDALAAWDEAKRLQPGDAALRRQIADALAARNQLQPALDELRAIEPLLAADPEALTVLERREADLARRAGDRVQAARILLRAFEAASSGRRPTREAEIAADLLRLYDLKPPRARIPAELSSVIARAEAEQPAVAGLRGELAATASDRAEALRAFRAAKAHRPDDAWVLRRLASLETGTEKLAALHALFELQRTDGTVGLELVDALIEARDSGGATHVAQTMRQRFGDNAALLGEMGKRLQNAGLKEEALAARERAVQIEPESPDAIVAWGDALRAAGRETEGVQAYFRLARDGSVVSYRQLIEVLSRRGLVAKVKEAYRAALERAGEDPTLRRDYARWLSANGFVAEAIAEWKKIHDGTDDAFLREFAARELKRLEWQQMLEK